MQVCTKARVGPSLVLMVEKLVPILPSLKRGRYSSNFFENRQLVVTCNQRVVGWNTTWSISKIREGKRWCCEKDLEQGFILCKGVKGLTLLTKEIYVKIKVTYARC